jgi:hypothetical protein
VTATDKDRLLIDVAREAKLGESYVLPVHLPLTMALALIANLQLSLRHPANTGASANQARHIVDSIIERLHADGYNAHARLAKLGDDPRYDIDA